jgi:hypothetical protein
MHHTTIKYRSSHGFQQGTGWQAHSNEIALGEHDHLLSGEQRMRN